MNTGIDNFIEGLLEFKGGGGAVADFGHGGYQKIITQDIHVLTNYRSIRVLPG
jgi:hypothetical protein